MSTVHLWTEELQLSGQKFKHLHGLLSHAQFKPLIGQRLWELSEAERMAEQAEQKGKQTIQQAFAAAAAKKLKQE